MTNEAKKNKIQSYGNRSHSNSKDFILIDNNSISILFHVACAYKQNQLLLIKYPNIFGADSLTYSPMIADGLLAIEMFFKFLKSCDLYLQGQATRIQKTHDLLRLYDDLNSNTQNEIEKRLNDEYILGNGLSSFLNNHSKDFVDYRYLTERKNYNNDLSFIAKLNDVLYEISRNVFNKAGLPIDENEYVATYDDDLENFANAAIFVANNEII